MSVIIIQNKYYYNTSCYNYDDILILGKDDLT